MDLEQYVKDDSIERDTISKLVDAKKDKVIIYGTISSIHKNPWNLGNGLLSSWRVYDIRHILTTKKRLALEKFDEIYVEVCNKRGPFGVRHDSRIDKEDNTLPYASYRFVDFDLGYGIPEFSFLRKWDMLDILEYGNKMRLSLKKLIFPLSSICYEPSRKSICYHYQDSYDMDYYSPITLD